jgi:hypothetical protein
MNGNAFRVLTDLAHRTGPNCGGRFDLWAVKTPDFKPLDLKPEPARAMMDLKAVFSASS